MTDTKPESEFWERRKLIRQSTLPMAAKLLLYVLAGYCGDDGLGYAPQEMLAWDASLSDRQLRNVLIKLRGIVTVEQRGRGLTNLHTIDWKQLADMQQDRKPTSAKTGNQLPVPLLRTQKKNTNLNTPLPGELDSPQFREAWTEWLKYRKAKRKPVSSRAAEMQLKKLAAVGVETAM